MKGLRSYLNKISSLILLVYIIFLFSCSGAFKTSSSEVTIIVGDNSRAEIRIENITILKKLKTLLVRLRTSSAIAQVSHPIPSYISSIKVTVDAPDMSPVIKSVDVNGQEVVIITIEVPNGLKRHFVVDALNAYGTLLNRGEALADLKGAPVTLVVDMQKTGLFVDAINGIDTNDCRTPSTPCKSITNTLAKTQGNEAIYVAQGTYDYSLNGEAFPLTLPPGTALICDSSAVIDSMNISGGPGSAFEASQQNHIHGCTFQNAWPAINDYGNPIIVSSIHVGLGSCVGVQISADTVVKDSIFENMGWGGCDTYGGVYITGASPIIKNNSFVSSSIYSALTIDGGTPVIRNNTIVNNSYVGINVLSGAPRINNNIISCNSLSDLISESNVSFDATNNSWDHAPPSTDPAGYCPNGMDICSISGTLPQYEPYLPPPQGACL